MKTRLVKSLVFVGLCWGMAGYAQAQQPDQPNMQAALRLLQQAQQRLEAALQDKGGHRAQAIELTKRAIAEVQAGINFSNEHSLGSSQLLMFDQFLDTHPAVSNDLRNNPNLINQEDYILNHPNLSEFLRTHPVVRKELRDHPQDFMDRENRLQAAQGATRVDLREFDEFLAQHRPIAMDLQRNPRLIDDNNYLNSHPDLRDYLNSHPQIRQAFRNNPRMFGGRFLDQEERQRIMEQRMQRR